MLQLTNIRCENTNCRCGGNIAKPPSPPAAAYHSSCPRAQTCPRQTGSVPLPGHRDTKICDKCNRPPRPATSCQRPVPGAPTCYRSQFSPDNSSSSSGPGMGAMVPYYPNNQGQRSSNCYQNIPMNPGGTPACPKSAHTCPKRY
uniref:Uncharacterized protein n=1 Tax=Cacopsylla melanoneura TaxID=428564 RepID=A0A8D9BPD9_9HEMI